MKTIACISGTSRPGNFSIRALGVVADELKIKSFDPQIIDPQKMKLDFPGHPATEDSKKLQELIKDSMGAVIVFPEYHGTYPAMTKLIIENLGFPSALSGKPVALIGVASGKIGAIKSIEQIKGVMSHVGALVVPGSYSIAGVHQVFDEEGKCTDPSVEKGLRRTATALEEYLKDYVCPKYTLEEMTRKGGAPWSTNV